jgi:cytochrome oxidase Cu insertion factor (SCO1/SenC/PrrC family)
MNTPIDDNQRRRGRRQLIFLASLFFVPLLVAFWLYYGSSGWRPAGGTNKGDLINPAVPLPAVVLTKPDGTHTPADFLQGKWTIAYLGDGACDERCRKALYLSRQTWISLNKDMDRVQRVFLATGPRVDTKALLAQIPALGGVAPAAAGRLYLIDPLGNLVLSYSAAAPDKALLTDVKKLLRLSHIG